MSEAIQINIPDFDDDDFSSTLPFGRPQATGLWGASSSGLESPTLTPVAERMEKSYFHSRGDSVTSEDSSHSIQYTSRKLKTPFAHSAQSSVATTSSSPFSKKTSFASLRNAFKSSKSNEPAPPVPSLDQQAYPALKNPFNRSTSSLAHATPTLHAHGRPSMHASPPHLRPSTPSSNDSKARSTPSSKAKGHTYARSQHSHSGSLFHFSDGGSDHGHGFLFNPLLSPPPVPPVPSGFGQFMSNRDSQSFPDLEEERIVMDARTPSEFALHAIFIRFATFAESLIGDFVGQPLDREPRLDHCMGSGVDPKFDDLLNSLGKIASKHAKPVVDSVMRWRKSQIESINSDLQHFHAGTTKTARTLNTSNVLAERKSLASIYIMCRALIAATQFLSRDSLPEAVGNSLEELTFEQFKRPDVKMLTQSVNHRAIAELYAVLLGNLANVRFETVTDRFLVELAPVASGQVPKDSDFKFENLVKGLNHVQINVWPPESFEEGAEFLESLSKSFDNAHGIRLKTVFAETLVHILHPIAKTAQAEVNHPQWAKAIELIYPKAKDMMSKPRYWQVAYPLAVTSLCIAPTEFFLRHWVPCFEAGLGKMKEKPYRMTVLNGMLRLIWTYLYRCHESASTATTKLESLLKHFFPPNRINVLPPEDRLEPFIYMVHFILSRHPDFGSEFCLELLQERSLTSSQSHSLSQFGPDRIAIASQAILLSVHLVEREESAPAWPSTADFAVIPPMTDYPTSSDCLSSPISRATLNDLLERSSNVLCTVARACFQSVGNMTILDEQWSSLRLGPTYEEAHSHVIRHHPEGSFAYSSQLIPQIGVLQTCYRSWPRCLHSTMPVESAFDMLLRGVIHVEPAVGEAASQALQRFVSDPSHAGPLLSRLCSFLFDPHRISTEGSSLRLMIECNRLLELLITVLDRWIQEILRRPRQSLTEHEKEAIETTVGEVEAGSLFLLSHSRKNIYSTGVKALRMMGMLTNHVYPELSSPGEDMPTTSYRIIDALLGKLSPESYLNGAEDILDTNESTRLEQWRRTGKPDTALRIADSDNVVDRSLWKHIYPSFIQACAVHQSSIPVFREKFTAAATRYHPLIVQLSGVVSKSPGGLPVRSASLGEKEGSKLVSENRDVVQQWHMWVKLICATAQVPESRPAVSYPIRDHSRARSEANVEREHMMTSRDLFKYLSGFLDSDHTIFRDVAVSCISSLPAYGYSYLLEDLSILAARQFYDEARTKPTSAPMIGRVRRQERFHTAVARIYYLTAHLIQEQRSSGKQTALTHVLKYIRNMQASLSAPENRDLFSLQRLRRYFCGTVERLFDGLTTLNDSDRFIPPGMHLALYRMCEEWCQLGKQSEGVKKRLVVMQTAAANSYQDPTGQAEIIQRFQTETRALSHAAVGAMASLIHKAFFPPDISASPIDKLTTAEYTKPLEAAPTLDRLTAILASFHEPVQACGKKALRSLLLHGPYDTIFADEVLRRAFVTTRDLATSNARFFEIVTDVICGEEHGFTFSQVVCLGLSNLCHPLVDVRRRAFSMLETIHEQSAGIISMVQYEAAVGSSAPSTYLQAHRLISQNLSGEHPSQALNVLAQFAGWIPRAFDDRLDRGPLILLQSLEFWVPGMNLMAEDKPELSREGVSAVYHLVLLTLRYAETHAEQVLVLWTRLLDEPYQSNGQAIIRFLLEQSHKVGSTIYISCAAKVVACLTQSEVGRDLFAELCSLIEPARMLPSIEHKLGRPDDEEMQIWSDLDELFSEQPRLSLGMAQFALLFLTETTMERYWEFSEQLPVLLHALFMHVDHRQPFVQERSRHMLFQLLRSCISGYDKLPDRSLYRSRVELKLAISELEKEADTRLWKEDDSSARAEPKMKWFSTQVLSLLEPLHPMLSEKWGSLALLWGTACSIRPIAFRSLQFFRALMPRFKQHDLGLLLGRLSITIADEDSSIQDFNVEIILTLTSMTTSGDLDTVLLPQMFWCAVACLSTTVEIEFRHVLGLLDALLTRIDLDDPHTANVLLSQKPLEWHGTGSLQTSLLTGMRSSSTSAATLKVLQHLAKINDSRLIDPTEARIRDLYTLSIPWCLRDMTTGSSDESLQEFAMNIGRLAEYEERPSITRIMTSFAKNRFRTKEDFLRQSVASLREHYGIDHWTEVVTLLVGLVLNKERWIRTHTMQVLKVLFQQRETRNPVDLLGSELLMPLLRLLETDLASEVLDVLEEPMQISGGPAAKHVLRMSMHHHLAADAKEVESVAEIFGIAQESGWCVPRSEMLRNTCRSNLGAVFDTCKVPSRPSRIDFQPEEIFPLSEDPLDDLGDLVQNLHELSSFFQEGPTSNSVPTKQLEARVAAILAKSTDSTFDVPQTPFVDVFDMGSLTSFDDSDDSSASDSDSDLFEFDSPQISRFTSNKPNHH